MNIPDDIKKEADEALKEHEGGSLSLWDVPHNAQEREYWKEVWMLGRMKAFDNIERLEKDNKAMMKELNAQSKVAKSWFSNEVRAILGLPPLNRG